MMALHAIVGAGIFACALYMILSRNLVRMLLGFSLLATGTNMLLLLAGRTGNAQPPIIGKGDTVLADTADPLIQAMILTAIVIGFALTVIIAVFVLRAWRALRSIDAGALDATEEPGASDE